ncbi:(2Fe-2S)-binding protein [Caballeronia insecticola]|uniref:Putative ferredoxin-containing oxidase n=1 Tax=Caballeronia insecticola TaxID=758793 RepID=R4X017_9BURK|nr:(2Fe-2S)-binding protein [Caballeronia insecticola]BAN25216.1 putative ferredoxin-containing oxidase [Caballeronia insecticola]
MADLVSVTIDGERLTVSAFTTVTAALALAGVRATRRSVTGAPRAALCGMGVCHECRVTVDGRAHVLGCQTLCREGQTIETGR